MFIGFSSGVTVTAGEGAASTDDVVGATFGVNTGVNVGVGVGSSIGVLDSTDGDGENVGMGVGSSVGVEVGSGS